MSEATSWTRWLVPSRTESIRRTSPAISAALGFVAGVVYLVQSHRLKHKKLSSAGLRLPSLEWLQTVNRICLLGSMLLMSVGLFSGMAMHLNRSGLIVWTDRGILLSCILFLWLVIASLFESLYKPARRGRKIAYLTLASFGFLVVAMVGLFTSNHGATTEQPVVSQIVRTLEAFR